MIKALIKRRLWLYKNRLVPSIFIFFLLPIFSFSMICLPLKNILRFSLSGTSYDIWAFSGLIFIIGSICLYPILYREYFELRVHRKVLINIALTPHSKKKIIFDSLITAIIESLLMIVISYSIFFIFIPISLTFTNTLFLLTCLIIYLFLLGNLYISLSLLIDALSIMLLMITMVFLYIIFGNGFLIEFPFFPSSIENILNLIPIALPFQVYQKFNEAGIIDWKTIFTLVLIITLWIFLNSYLLKHKLQQ